MARSPWMADRGGQLYSVHLEPKYLLLVEESRRIDVVIHEIVVTIRGAGLPILDSVVAA